MSLLKSAFRSYRRLGVVVLLFLAALTGGTGCARATDLANGQVVFGSVSGSGTDTYTFTVSSGSYIISIWESGGHSTSSNAGFYVTRPNSTNTGGFVDGNYDNGTEASVGILPGTYTVTVFNDEGAMTAAAYGLQVEWVPGTVGVPSGQAGGALQPSATYSDSVNIGAEDIWTFQGLPTGTFSATITKTGGGAGFCPYMQIFTPTGGNYAVTGTCTSVSRGGGAVAGTYYVYVTNDFLGNDTGTYSLQVSGSAVDMSGQGNGDGATCLTCAAKHHGPTPQSAQVTAIGAAATK